MAKSSSGLSDKQRRFVCEYLVDSNGARAAVAAGYGVAGSRVAAHRLLTNANVQIELQARQSQMATRLTIKRTEVLKRLLDAYAIAEAQGNPAAMVSAARECGRLMGYYSPHDARVQIGRVQPATEERSYAGMSDAELVRATQGQQPRERVSA